MSDCRCGRNCQSLDALVDCSDEAQEQRRQRIQALKAQRYSLLTSVSDRSRSVAFARQEIGPLLNELLAEQFFCEFGYWPLRAGRRVLPPPLLVKGL